MTDEHATLTPRGLSWVAERFLNGTPVATLTIPIGDMVRVANEWLAFQGYRALGWRLHFDTGFITDLEETS